MIGCGSIGQRHIRNLLDRGVVVVGVDPDPRRRDQARAKGAVAISDLSESPDVDAVFVCTPASDHADRAREVLAAGYDLFIEKPLTTSLTEAYELLRSVKASDRIVTVGYNLRFDAALVAFRNALLEARIGRVLYTRLEFAQYLPDWRPGRDYRATVSARAATGGGILLEASHELDLLHWLVGKWAKLTAMTKRLSDLEIDVEDTAVAIVELANGSLAELHLDFVRRGYTRRVTCVGTIGTLEWNLHSGSRHVDAEGRVRELATAAPPNAMYAAEVDEFLQCIRHRTEPLVSVEDGVEALALVDAIRKSSAAGMAVAR